MSVAILVGGRGADGNVEHRYLVDAFLERFGERVTRIVTADPPPRPTRERLVRMLRRGDYLERWRRARWRGGYGPDPDALARAFEREGGRAVPERMPGGARVATVASHNGSECAALLDAAAPDVLVVYGTAILREHLFARARVCALNLHTGLSPWYRGDSTLFWPVHDDAPDRLGVTVHRLVADVDGGDIAATVPVRYVPGDTEADLFARGVVAGTAAYLDAVDAALDGSIVFRPQDLSLGREFRWRDRTVAAERRTLARLDEWAHLAPGEPVGAP